MLTSSFPTSVYLFQIKALHLKLKAVYHFIRGLIFFFFYRVCQTTISSHDVNNMSPLERASNKAKQLSGEDQVVTSILPQLYLLQQLVSLSD